MALTRSVRRLVQSAPRPQRRPAMLSLLLAVVACVLLAPDAAAFRQWCRTDPIVRIGGKEVNIFVSSDPAILGRALGPTQVVVAVPKGVSTELIATDAGFGHGESVTFTQTPKPRGKGSAIAVVVAVYVPADASFPVLVEFIPQNGTAPASVEGVTNSWITLRATA